MTDDNNLNDLNEIDEEEMGDEDATLADDLLDEIDDEEVVDEALEGFGIIDEDSDEEDDEEDDGLDDEDESLEDDAEDVDYDRFDDIDEM
jgi:hypothetical protein